MISLATRVHPETPKGVLYITAIVLAMVWGSPARSATADTADATQSSSGLEEIVVTAQRRSENLEKVPVSVTVLTSEQLAERQITSSTDLQRAVPGLTVRQVANQNDLVFSLRGQSVDPYSFSSPAVLPYIDEVPFNSLSAGSIYDMESVQVLKGPQGTLFGRNVTGGSILYTTVKPGNELGGFVTARAGNFGLVEGVFGIDIPIVSDKVLLRLAGDAKHQDGYVYNLYRGQWLGQIDNYAFRPTLVLKSDLRDWLIRLWPSSITLAAITQVILLTNAYACGSTNNGIPLATSAGCLYGPTLDAAIGVPGAWEPTQRRAIPKAYPGGIVAFGPYAQSLGPWVVDRINTFAA